MCDRRNFMFIGVDYINIVNVSKVVDVIYVFERFRFQKF